MNHDIYLIIAVVGVFSIFQSIFGMGILVFGTPTLLLLGFDFITTLSYLLPASWAISFMQILNFEKKRPDIPLNLYLLCLPSIGIGLILSGSSFFASYLNNLIGGTLILSSVIRYWTPAREIFSISIKENLALYHIAMGIAHGLTNLGGALLAILANEMHSSKNNIQYTIAFYYCAFNSIQILILVLFLGQIEIMIANAFTAIISSIIYIFLGNRIFHAVSSNFFTYSFTLFMMIYGILILLNNDL